ncbi:MAG: MBG domain-containing protein, partial [Leptospirales bacterium]
TYGSAIPTLSGTVSGFVGTDSLAGGGGTTTFTTSATSSSNAGTYGITGAVSGLSSTYLTNYTVIQSPSNGSALTIGNATLAATANSASMSYGGTIPTLSGTVTGFVNGQSFAGDGGAWTTTATSASNAGSYGVNASLATPYSGDYTIVPASGNATALTIKAAVVAQALPPIDALPLMVLSLPFSGTTIESEAPSSDAVSSNGTTAGASNASSATTSTSSSSGSSSVSGLGGTESVVESTPASSITIVEEAETPQGTLSHASVLDVSNMSK